MNKMQATGWSAFIDREERYLKKRTDVERFGGKSFYAVLHVKQ